MYIDTLIQGMPDSSVEKVTDCLQKLETNNYISTQEAKDAYEICKNHHSYLSDDDAKMGLIRLCAKAWEFNDIEMRALEHIRQRRETLQNLSEPQYYASIVNIAQKINFQYDYFRPISEINQTFNELSNDRDLRTLLDINRYLNLSEPLMVELMKSQCQQNFAGNHQTDELIQKIDQAGKLSELPEKAFDNLSSYLIKQVNDNVHHDAKIDDNSKSEAFKKALKNQSLSDDEAQKILPTYDELCANNKTSVLPRKLDDKFKQLGTEQDNKRKSSAPFNVQNLLNKLAGGQSLTPFQALYLHRYLSKEQKYMPPHYRVNVDKMLANIPSELVEKAADYQKELIDPKAIEVIGQVIEQIQNEENRLANDGIYVPELNAHLKPTSNFMEIRPVDELKLTLDTTISNLLENPNMLPKFEGDFLSRHEGVDFTGIGENDGILTYQYGFEVKPDIAKVLGSTDDISSPSLREREAKNITIVEYHYLHGVLLSTFRHVQEVPSSIVSGVALTQNQQMGSYVIKQAYLTAKHKEEMAKDKNYIAKEHVHIERKYANADTIKGFTIQELENRLKNVQEDNSAEIKNEVATSTHLVQPMIIGNDYHAIALFTPESDLNKQFMQEMQQNWLKDTASLIKKEKITTPRDAYQYLKNKVVRDRLMLNTIAEILIKVKLLLEQVGETNSALERLIQIAQQSANALNATQIPNKFKITN